MPHLPPLTILEEFLILALDDRAGEFWPVPRSAFDCGTATAVLMDLMRLRRIDCDLHRLLVVNIEPTNDEILDPILSALALEPVKEATRAVMDEIRFLADEGESLRDHAVKRLVERGILDSKERRFLWIFGTQRYPIINDHSSRTLKLRILNVILGEGIPDPRDIALVSLLQACEMFRYILSPRELAEAGPRITQVARMDILGRVAAEAITEIEASIAMASGLR